MKSINPLRAILKHLVQLTCLLLFITGGKLYAQTSGELLLRKQLQEESRNKKAAQQLLPAQLQNGIIALGGNLSNSPNPGSIHVNRNLIYRDYTPAQLVEQIFVKGGACVSVNNIILRSHGWDTLAQMWTDDDYRGLGYFSRGTSNFEFEEGLLLSTGGLVSIEGPNMYTSGVDDGILQELVMGDDDLQDLLPPVHDVYNVSVLEFDFVPAGNLMQFRYVFASEEYLYYVGSQFNDVFGFFVTDSSGNTQNIALLPTTTSGTSIVSINNVNWGTESYTNHNCADSTNPSSVNGEYYINIPLEDPYSCVLSPEQEALMASMEFNGRTVVLTAIFAVIPCQTYHLKLAVGNVVDGAFHSGVFLEARSFDIGGTLVNYGNGIEGMDYVYNGCTNNELVVSRPTADNSSPLTVNLTYSGTAVNGTHISLYPVPGSLPTSVIIPAGQQSVAIPYQVSVADYRYFTVTGNCPCALQGTDSITIHLYPSDANLQANASPSCPGQNNGRIFVTGSGGSGHYECSIDGGITWHSSVSGLVPNSYTVHLRDTGSCHVTTVNNIIVGTTSVYAGPNQSLCDQQFTMAAPALNPGETGSWSVVSGTASITNPSSPTSAVTLTSSSATLRWTLNLPGCQVTGDVTLTVLPTVTPTITINVIGG